ncbi:MAG TPA: hypothetical protein VEW42_06165 [Candidatus Eisenbacteria bacterium]|nr:hypothetical protein [Candidatus Eisenbacteria bacterium]
MKIVSLLRNREVILRSLGVFLLCLLYVYLYKLLIPRINAFGCMDDCNNFMGGYFLLQGKQLFSQIFFNHAPFMAHISAFIQFATRPENLHELILRHRQFILLFGFVSEVFLILRFGIVGLPFALLYETTKFYLAGDRFLGEGLIVYPFVYLLGLMFNKLNKKLFYAIDYVLSAVFVWFVIFTREPYSIAILFMFFILLWRKGQGRIKLFSLGLLIVLSCITVFSYNLSELIYNMVTVNSTTLAAENADSGVLGINIYKVFLYPFIIFFQGEWNFVRYIELGLSAVFLFANAVFLWKRQWKWLIILWIVLGLSNFRLVRPGHEFYGAFHLLPWYSMTIFATCLMLATILKWNKWLFALGCAGFVGILLYLFISKGSYVYDHIDQQTEFITNYGNYLQVGNVVNSLSQKKDTLFVDGFDDAIYLVAKRYSPYEYSWYTSLMPLYKKYTDARENMFAKSPPDFYYGNCPGQKNPVFLLPDFVKGEYMELFNGDKPSCLWVRKSKVTEITDSQWQKAGENLYYLEPHSR